MSPGWPEVTVAILTWNGEKHIDAILRAIETQHYPGTVSTLVIDSGSTDATLDIIARHPSVRLHTIPNSEFGHGSTRNLAAALSTGEIVAYLTHDAVPASENWLIELVRPMVDDERVAAVVGKQIPRPDCPPVIKYDIQRVFARLGPDDEATVVIDDGQPRDGAALARATFYSDANSAARRSVLTGPVPYRDVDYAEDQLFGRDLFARGYGKAYAPAAAVEHSNDLGLRESGRRILDEVVGLRAIGTAVPRMSILGALARAIKWSLLDARLLVADREFSIRQRAGWLFANPVYQLVKWFSYRAGTRRPLSP